MARSAEVFAIIKSDLSRKDRDYINKIINEYMEVFKISRDKDTFYAEKSSGGKNPIFYCINFYFKLEKYREYFDVLGCNNYLFGGIEVTEEISGSEYNKIREICWIPVNEGYPDDTRLVLVTLQYENGKYEIDVAEYRELNDYGIERYPEQYGFGRRHKNVVAWADLPSPYIKVSKD